MSFGEQIEAAPLCTQVRADVGFRQQDESNQEDVLAAPVSNIFDIYRRTLLSRLAAEMPKRLNLNPADFGLPEEDDGNGVADIWDGWSNTVEWLEREKYIRYEVFSSGTCGEPCFYGLELTELGRSKMFSEFPQAEIDVIGPDGQVRCKTKAIIDSTLVIIPDSRIEIYAGDEIRRRLPNGVEEAFDVVDPTFYDEFDSTPAHYQVNVRRKGTFTQGTGGNYTFNVSGPNARVNFHSTDNSRNSTGSNPVFGDLKSAIQNSGLNASEIAKLQNSIAKLEASTGQENYKSEYQSFIQDAAAYMTIISPFIPALTALL